MAASSINPSELQLHRCIIGIDIGGSLTKLAILFPEKQRKPSVHDLIKVAFPTEDFPEFAPKLQYASKIYASGGGAVKHKAALPPHTEILDELSAVIRGIRMQYGERFRDEFILANCGTGASIVHVQQNGTYARIGGTAVCGGMFAGLSKMLLNSNKPWTEIQRLLKDLALSETKEAHTLVGDIYGNRQDIYGLPADLVAGFLGKVNAGGDPKVAVAALQEAITFNLAHLTWVTAKPVTDETPTMPLVFTGSYLKLPRTTEIVDQAMELLQPSGGFYVHGDGYSGAVGCLTDFIQDVNSVKQDIEAAIRQDSGVEIDGVAEIVEN